MVDTRPHRTIGEQSRLGERQMVLRKEDSDDVPSGRTSESY